MRTYVCLTLNLNDYLAGYASVRQDYSWEIAFYLLVLVFSSPFFRGQQIDIDQNTKDYWLILTTAKSLNEYFITFVFFGKFSKNESQFYRLIAPEIKFCMQGGLAILNFMKFVGAYSLIQIVNNIISHFLNLLKKNNEESSFIQVLITNS